MRVRGLHLTASDSLHLATSRENAEDGKFIEITAGAMPIKEQIGDLVERYEDTGMDVTRGGPIPVADLKALAASHTALLTAAQVLRDITPPDERKECFPGLESIISEAEKL